MGPQASGSAPVAADERGDLDDRIGGEVRHRAVVLRGDDHVSVGVAVDGGDGLAGGIGVVGATALGELLGLVVELRVLVELKELVLGPLHDLGAALALAKVANLLGEHLLVHVVVTVVAARDHAHGVEHLKRQLDLVDVAGMPLSRVVEMIDDVVRDLAAPLVPHAVPVEVVEAREAEREAAGRSPRSQ